MGSKVTVTAAILLLLAYGTEGAVTAVTSLSPAFLVNTPINLTFTADTLNAVVNWEKDSTPIISFFNNAVIAISNIYNQRVTASTPTSLLISNAKRNDSGSYTVTVTDYSAAEVDSAKFQVSVYDPVTNVTLVITPELVSEVTPIVNLTCGAASGAETFTWQKDGASLPSNISSSFLDGNRTLQLNKPNETYNGNYTCNVSNPVDWKFQTKELKVYLSSSALSTGAIIGIVIGSVCGALLLIALIILIVCCVKRRKGKKEKNPPVSKHTDVLRTVSGNTLSPDDPAFFTVNNIMYRNSSISMGSYNMDQHGHYNQKFGAGWRVSERNGVSTQNSRTPSVNPSMNYGTPKHLTQV